MKTFDVKFRHNGDTTVVRVNAADKMEAFDVAIGHFRQKQGLPKGWSQVSIPVQVKFQPGDKFVPAVNS